MHQSIYAFVLLALIACKDKDEDQDMKTMKPDDSGMVSGEFAVVTKISASGSDGSYTFSVTLSSPDTGCDQYADWWEVFDEDEKLLYRRILAHSHVNEQPFTRSGGPVKIAADSKVWVRAHMNNTGYGTQVFFGSVKEGFEEKQTDAGFASELKDVDPLPGSCAF